MGQFFPNYLEWGGPADGSLAQRHLGRLTQVQIDALPAQPNGTRVFNLDADLEQDWNGASWENVSAASEPVQVLTSANNTDVIKPGFYDLDADAAFSVTLEEPLGQYRFANSRLNLSATNTVTIIAANPATETFTDASGAQVAGPMILDTPGYWVRIVAENANDWHTVDALVVPPTGQVTIDASGWAAPGSENAIGVNTGDGTLQAVVDKLEAYDPPVSPVDWAVTALPGVSEQGVGSIDDLTFAPFSATFTPDASGVYVLTHRIDPTSTGDGFINVGTSFGGNDTLTTFGNAALQATSAEPEKQFLIELDAGVQYFFGTSTSTPGASVVDTYFRVRSVSATEGDASSPSFSQTFVAGDWTLNTLDTLSNLTAATGGTINAQNVERFQSFTSPFTGEVPDVIVNLVNSGGGTQTAQITFYDGAGTGGTVLGQTTVTVVGNVETGYTATFPAPAPVVASQDYTVGVVRTGASTDSLGWHNTGAVDAFTGHTLSNGLIGVRDGKMEVEIVPTGSSGGDFFIPAVTHGLGAGFKHVTVFDAANDIVILSPNVDPATGNVTLSTNGAVFAGSVLIS